MAGSGKRDDDGGEKEGHISQQTLECAINREKSGLVALEG